MTSDPKRPSANEIQPYPPSFLDRLMDFIERLPFPYWLTYLILFIAQSTLMHILAWLDGLLPAYTFSPILFLLPGWLWLPLAIMTYLDSVSLQALSILSPLLDLEETGLKRLKYEFTTMPSRGVILSSAVWGIVYGFLWFVTIGIIRVYYGMDAFYSVVLGVEGLIVYMIGGPIYFHSLRLLHLINRTVKTIKNFNLFRLDPVYAFSRVTAFIGVSWMFLLTFTLLLFPIQMVRGATLAILILQVVLAIAAFMLPLWFVHRRLVTEKLKLLEELNLQVESTTARLHRSLDKNEMGPVTQLKDAMLGLAAEREVLKEIPTWPWRSGTMAGFLSAIVLPIILFILQVTIGKLLGR